MRAARAVSAAVTLALVACQALSGVDDLTFEGADAAAGTGALDTGGSWGSGGAAGSIGGSAGGSSGGSGGVSGSAGAEAGVCWSSSTGMTCDTYPWVDNAECTSCIKAECCTQIDTCFAQPGCLGAWECLSQHCAGLANQEALFACMEQSCPGCVEAAGSEGAAALLCVFTNCNLCTCPGPCNAGQTCVDGTCMLADGQPCTDAPNACASGNCVDGVCCNAPCTDWCFSCNQTKGPGICSACTYCNGGDC